MAEVVSDCCLGEYGGASASGRDEGILRAALKTRMTVCPTLWVVPFLRSNDHIGSLRQFQDTFGVRVVAHEMDAGAIEQGGGVVAEFYRVDYVPSSVDLKIQGSEGSLRFGSHELKLIHIPGHTPGSLAAYIDIYEKRVLFGQDVHGPYIPQWGADPVEAGLSQKLIDLRADVLCEGHFGVYQPASEVEEYIRGYRDSL